MSYDFGVCIDSGGDDPASLSDRNITSNLSRMFAEALGIPFRDLDGAPCSEAAGVVNRAVERMKADPQRYEALNPENGWGDYDGALTALSELLADCQRHPKARIHVHY